MFWVMYAGAVAVPLILGRALKLSPEDVAFLISADLFACGLATLVQSVGFPGVGIRLPVMMGVTFASVGPMLSMAAAPDIGLLGIYGSVISAGVFALVVAPFMGRLLPLFPPVVTGTIILVIGISLMRVGINWAGGGLPTLTKVVDGAAGAFPNPNYGQLQGLGIALFVLLVILVLLRFFQGFVATSRSCSASSPAPSSLRFSASCISSGSCRHRGPMSLSRSVLACRNFNWCRSSPCASSWWW
jgi:xanthine/uracil permease